MKLLELNKYDTVIGKIKKYVVQHLSSQSILPLTNTCLSSPGSKFDLPLVSAYIKDVAAGLNALHQQKINKSFSFSSVPALFGAFERCCVDKFSKIAVSFVLNLRKSSDFSFADPKMLEATAETCHFRSADGKEEHVEFQVMVGDSIVLTCVYLYLLSLAEKRE